MAINQDFPIYNGVAPSWADISVRLTPEGLSVVEIKDIAAINLNTSVEVGVQRSVGGRIARRTLGQDTYEGTITFYRSGLQNFIRVLKDAALSLGHVRGPQAKIRLVHFDVDVQHTPPNDDEIYQRIARGCFLTGAAINAAEGTDAEQVEVPINPAQIVDVVDGTEVALIESFGAGPALSFES